MCHSQHVAPKSFENCHLRHFAEKYLDVVMDVTVLLTNPEILHCLVCKKHK